MTGNTQIKLCSYVKSFLFFRFSVFFHVLCFLICGGYYGRAGYNITEKEFKQISKWAENVYNIAVIVDYFVSKQPEIEECYNLAPVIKNLRQNADLLNVFFIDNEKCFFYFHIDVKYQTNRKLSNCRKTLKIK